MRSSRETKILNIVCIILIVLVGVIRMTAYQCQTFTYNSIVCVLLTTATVIWIFQIQRRLIQGEVRRYLTMLALLVICWMLQRTIKYEYLFEGGMVNRYAWYMYYIFQTFGILFMFLSVLYIGRPQDNPISPRWKLLYIPAVLISAGIMTNDLHQLAFRFCGGLGEWNEKDYIHGVLYYISVIWVALLFLAMLTVVLVKCRVPSRRRKIWMPMIPILAGVIYMITFFVKTDSILMQPLKVPEMVCIIFIAFMECLIMSQLFPSNDNYGDFWNASSIGAGIMDDNGEIHYKSEFSAEVNEEQVRSAEFENVLLSGGSIALRSHRVNGGYGYWTKDISAINSMNMALENLGDVLSEENAMLEAENELEENRIMIRQQSTLYDSMAESVSTQLNKIGELLENPPQDETEFENVMKHACILNVYVKRYSNIFLMSREDSMIYSDELRLAISESLEYVKLYGIKAYGDYRGEDMFRGEKILLAYEVYQAVLEAGIPTVDAMLVNVNVSSKGITLNMQLNSPKEILPQYFQKEAIEEINGTLTVDMEEDTEYVTLTLPGGDA